jgi:hypothetical protein
MDDTDHDKREAELLARLEAERETRIAEKIAGGEIVSVPLCTVAGSETEARAQVERAKANALAELREKGDQREVVFAVTLVTTGVRRHGEAADPAAAPSAPGFASGEDAPRQHLPPPVIAPTRRAAEVIEEEVREEPQPALIEIYVCVQVGQCQDDDDPGEVVEGYFSVDGKVVTVTDATGRHVGSRAMREGEDPKAVAKRLLREKTPEAESFNRVLNYSNTGLA